LCDFIAEPAPVGMKLYDPILAVTLASAPAIAAPRHDLSVATANMLDFNTLSPEGDWHQRYSNLVTQIVGSGLPPDIIALTETRGWESCWLTTTAQDYDAFDPSAPRRHRRAVPDRIPRRGGVHNPSCN
jgi:hypothetical protein